MIARGESGESMYEVRGERLSESEGKRKREEEGKDATSFFISRRGRD